MSRTKAIVYHCAEELYRSSVLNAQGLFRVSGSRDTINQMVKDYSFARYPSLQGEYFDPHILTGLLKATLREMGTRTHARTPHTRTHTHTVTHTHTHALTHTCAHRRAVADLRSVR